MSNATLALVVAVVGIMVTAAGVYLGIPAWRLSRHSVRTQEQADEQAEFNRRLMRALTGNPDDRRASDEHPPAMDLLYDIREMLKEHNELTVIVAHHVADLHGPPLPALAKRRR